MASYTTNLNLELPTVNERYDILKVNSNMEKIDDGYGVLNDQMATKLDKPTTYHLNANSSVSITLKARGSYLVCVNSNNGTGLYVVVNYNYGGTVTTIVNTSSVTLSMSGVVLTVANNVAYPFGVQVLPLWEEINNDT